MIITAITAILFFLVLVNTGKHVMRKKCQREHQQFFNTMQGLFRDTDNECQRRCDLEKNEEKGDESFYV